MEVTNLFPRPTISPFAWSRLSFSDRFELETTPEPNSGCFFWLGQLNDRGYGIFKGRNNGRRVNILAHRESYKTFIGQIPDGMFVLHKCDIRCCVNPGHLFLGTAGDNIADMDRKGRRNPRRGEHNHSAKLTDAQVAEIRALPKGTWGVARKYGVSSSTISQLRSGVRRSRP